MGDAGSVRLSKPSSSPPLHSHQSPQESNKRPEFPVPFGSKQHRMFGPRDAAKPALQASLSESNQYGGPCLHSSRGACVVRRHPAVGKDGTVPGPAPWGRPLVNGRGPEKQRVCQGPWFPSSDSASCSHVTSHPEQLRHRGPE